MEVAKRQKMEIHEGVYAMNGGPQFESPAEIRMLKMIGADAIGRDVFFFSFHLIDIGLRSRK